MRSCATGERANMVIHTVVLKKYNYTGEIVSGRKYIPHSQSPLNVSVHMYITHSQSKEYVSVSMYIAHVLLCPNICDAHNVTNIP